MNRKKIITNGVLTVFAVATLIITAVSHNGDNIFDVRGEPTPYSIVLGTNKNKIVSGPPSGTGYSGTDGVMTTELGNDIAISYQYLENPTTHWQTLSGGGFITNTSPIHGMMNMSLVKRDSSANLKIYYSSTATFSEDKVVVFDTSSPLSVSTNFNNELPNYFKIEAVGFGDSAINSGVIEFDCSNHYRTLSLVNNNPTMGSIEGDGYYKVGSNVTISVNRGLYHYFTGWYDASDTLVSNEYNYTFAMPDADTTFTAKFAAFSNIGTIAKNQEVSFGVYPQVEMKGADHPDLVAALNAAAGTLPTAGNNQAWTDYGYYIKNVKTSYMWYIDISHGADTYRGVYITKYRPTRISYESNVNNTVQEQHGYRPTNVYWFKFEPIKWRVLDVVSDKALLFPTKALDAQDYNYTGQIRNIDGTTVYGSNYKHSTIRQWINNDFYNTAFNSEEGIRSQYTIVDNSASTTGANPNPLACENTNDKLFLLSYVDVTNANYGFTSNTTRLRTPTDYGKAQGMYMPSSTTMWNLRSPYYDAANPNITGNVYYINTPGTITQYPVDYTYRAVMPALWIWI
ncbi:MAG: hypothetical protein BWX74_00293 [Tenericutes bacterium ADurb.Bin087]|nr:MAG: hypothetical protein BWX74_00293 [Tenericutes bacterium ADurb.Bin087]